MYIRTDSRGVAGESSFSRLLEIESHIQHRDGEHGSHLGRAPRVVERATNGCHATPASSHMGAQGAKARIGIG